MIHIAPAPSVVDQFPAWYSRVRKGRIVRYRSFPKRGYKILDGRFPGRELKQTPSERRQAAPVRHAHRSSEVACTVAISMVRLLRGGAETARLKRLRIEAAGGSIIQPSKGTDTSCK